MTTIPSFTQAVDYVWDRKIRFLALIAALFFAINGLMAMNRSFTELKTLDIKAGLPAAAVEASSTPTVNEESNILATSTERTPESYTVSNSVSSQPLTSPSPSSVVHSSVTPQTGLLPDRIVIARFGISSPVSNPVSTNIDSLNDVLTRAVVRYNGSGTMTDGNMFIMGHSSELPIVHNPMYKVFNNLKNLVAGDEIKVYAGTHVNTYRVTSVKMLNVHDANAYVPFITGSKKLTLVTCNVRAEKSDRYLVEAEFVSAQ